MGHKILSELKNKKRSVNDLARFIKTRTDDNPNYSILLGAGCSVSSGINPASNLISSWRSDIYLELSLANKYFEVDAIKYLQENESSWYDKRYEYSSLFEKKYDLPRQRRMFIESQVEDKAPALGYAYLISLVDSGYFKTLFTTNFDDLINEAFYKFSDKRPIVCAHDSSVNSITVTSSRPKVIKLHGDYLFDDIKSTVRETESLEENMKNKFTEFCKDYGLIIIGYSGNDRSIMDVLQYLLKQDEYFKHGIYWCFRENDEINEDVRKLLWKEKVYYVEIDGFDELMAELHSLLKPKILPIDTSMLSDKSTKMIQVLSANEQLLASGSRIIKEDIKKLKALNVDRAFSDIIAIFSDNESETSYKRQNKVGKMSAFRLFKIQEKISSGFYDDALSEIDNELTKAGNDRQFIKELNVQKAKCFNLMGKSDEAIKCYNSLISSDKNDVSNYLSIINLKDNILDKRDYIDRLIEVAPYNANAYEIKATIEDEIREDTFFDTKLNEEQIIALYDRSLEIEPSLDNISWEKKYFILEKHENKNSEKLKEYIEDMKKKNPYHISVIILNLNLLKKNEANFFDISDYVKNVIKYHKYIDQYYIYLKFSELLLSINKENEVFRILTYIEENFDLDDSYYLLNARAIFNVRGDIYDAEVQFKRAIEYNNSLNNNRMLLEFYFNIDALKKIEELLASNPKLLDEAVKYDLAMLKTEYDEAIKIVDSLIIKFPYDLSYVIKKSYTLLKAEKYKETEEYLKPYINNSSIKEIGVFVNYSYAKKKQSDSYNKKRVEMEITNHSEYDTKAALYALLDRRSDAIDMLEKLYLNKPFTICYNAFDWVIFKDYISDKRFVELKNKLKYFD
ncbi:MAG: SIR2 family protein [Deferribacterales bacterium]